MSMTIDAVHPAQERQDLVDVARRDHLGHLDPRRREQDVDARRVAPEDVGEVGLGDPVGRQVEDRGASTGTLSSERRSPNWRLPSIRTVRCSTWAKATARLNAIVVLPTPPFGAKTRITRDVPVVGAAVEFLADGAIRFIRSKPENGIASTPWMPARRIDLDRVLRHGQDDDRHAEAGLGDLARERQPLDPALEQRVDEDDVGPQLLDLGSAFVPSLRTSSSFTALCALSRPRMYCATWGRPRRGGGASDLSDAIAGECSTGIRCTDATRKSRSRIAARVASGAAAR